MSVIKLDALPKMQSAIKDTVKFRGATSSTDYNKLQEDMFFDVSNLFNVVSEYENRLNETSTLQSIDNLYTQMKMKEYETENDRLKMELERYMYNYQKKYTIDVFNASAVDVTSAPTVNKMFNQINLSNHNVTSKLYLYDEAIDLITIPSSLSYSIMPEANGIDIVDNEFTNAFNGNMNEYYVRRIISNDTLPKEMEIVIELPDNIISSRDINAIEISPFPYASVDITSMEYQLNGNWTQIPGFASHQYYQSDMALNEYGDLVDTGAIRSSENVKLCFNKTAMARIKIKLKQSTYTVENNKFVFYMGIKYLNVNCENVVGNYCEFYSDIVLHEDAPKLITKIVPYFNNDLILSDQTDEKKTLMSYELYAVDEDGAREYIKNSFPIVAHDKRYMLVTKMYYDRSADINPSLAKLEVFYELTEAVEDDKCTCHIKSIDFDTSDLSIPYDKEAIITMLNANANVESINCPIETHNGQLQPTYKYKIKSTDATVSINNSRLISKDSGSTIITVETFYNGKRAQKDFRINTVKEESPLFELNYTASSGGSIIGQTQQHVSWKSDGTPVEAINDERSKFVAWSDGIKTSRRVDTEIRNNINAEALFETKKYSVTFRAYKNVPVLEDVKTVFIPHGQPASAPVIADIDGYKFKSWDNDFSEITSATIVNAEYIRLHRVVFVDYDGRTIYSQYVEDGAAAIAPSNPVRAGYTFDRWDINFDAINADTTITALYTIKSFKVIFKDYDGTELKQETVTYKGSATPPIISKAREGYEHTGWDKPYVGIIKDVEVIATYKLKKYTIEFVDEAGKLLSSQVISHGAAATPPSVPSLTGKTFLGWFTGEVQVTDFTNIKADKKYTAKYKASTYKITMPTIAGVTFSPKNGTVEHGGNFSFAFSVDQGYEIEQITINGSPAVITGNSYTIMNVKGDVTVGVSIVKKKYTVKWLSGEGSEIKTESVPHGGTATPPTPPNKTGYTFAGWEKK